MLLNRILENLKHNDKKIVYRNLKNYYTYASLYKYVKNVYKFMGNNNIINKKIIVYGHKDISMIASFLGCSFSGNTYIPIDDSIPKDRLKFIINEARPAVFINTTDEKIDISDKNIKYVNKNDITKIMESENFDFEIEPLLDENDIYYIIYTSGSTGNPKGVKITYKNL